MALTNEQREKRRRYIGSSDSPAICGVDPFRTAADVYLEKTGQVEDFAGNEATERGVMLEPVLLDWAEKRLGPLSRHVFMERGQLCANLDGCDPGQFIVEAKTTTDLNAWGDEDQGNDAVPEKVLVQVHHALHVTGLRLAYVPVLLPIFGRFDLRLYEVTRIDELADAVAAKGAEFMEKYVLTRTAPPDSVPSLDVLKRVRRTPNYSVPLSRELFDDWLVCRAAAKQACEAEDEAKAKLIASLGAAEAGEIDGQQVLTYFEQSSERVSTELLRRLHPEIAAECVKKSTFRVLREKKAKAVTRRAPALT